MCGPLFEVRRNVQERRERAAQALQIDDEAAVVGRGPVASRLYDLLRRATREHVRDCTSASRDWTKGSPLASY